MTDSRTGQRDDTIADAALRVNLKLLDTLMNLAGELVLSRNQLLQSVKAEDMKGIALSSQRIDLITSDLQEAIMHTRMQPIDTIMNGFSDLTRGWAETDGKSLDLSIRGNEVELDKTILEALQAPLEGVLRHLVDLGLEAPEARQQQGKDHTGLIAVTAEHDAGQVSITLTDDGRGLDPEDVVTWALSGGLATEEETGALTDRQKMELLFRSICPAKEGADEDPDATIASGIESLGGTLDISAVPGSGTRIQIKLPLTLAIIPSQIAAVGDERYALPQVNLNELIRIPAAQVKDKIEKVGDAAVVRLRGALLPLLDLAGLLDIERSYVDETTGDVHPERRKNIADRRSRQLLGKTENTSPEDKDDWQARLAADRRQSKGSATNIAVVSAGAYKYGLVVDRFLDAEEIVVKPMGRHMKGCDAYAGATIMGDGKVALILDISNLAAMAELATSDETKALDREIAETEAGDTTELILFKNGDTEHLCAPQDRVARIERIRTADIEEIGNTRVIQYRGGSLPLFTPNQVADVGPLPEKADQEVLVLKTGDKEIGLMVTPPVDTVAVALEVDDSTLSGRAVTGSAVINGNTTLVLDVDEMVRILKPEWD
ncbi:MAG: chemotaxis protein CheW [Desulfobacterales bacterium]|nr:chemotaxis protein CheW [Desulfobacterales bacterium]